MAPGLFSSKNLSRDKHSSLFWLAVIDDEGTSEYDSLYKLFGESPSLNGIGATLYFVSIYDSAIFNDNFFNLQMYFWGWVFHEATQARSPEGGWDIKYL